MITVPRLIFLLSFILLSCNETVKDNHVKELPSSLPNDSSVMTSKSTIPADTKDSTSREVFYINKTDSITIGVFVGGQSCRGDAIYFNDKLIFCGTDNGFVYDSKYNRIIEENNHILLFVETMGQPNFNHITGYDLNKTSAKLIVDCVYNDEVQRKGIPPFTDIDKDGYLELGGFDLTEQHPSADSMYYIPSDYYEIKNGIVSYDSSLTKKMDIKENGIYLKQSADIHGYCCKVIPKPKHKHKK
jgi:hypothetical protein